MRRGPGFSGVYFELWQCPHPGLQAPLLSNPLTFYMFEGGLLMMINHLFSYAYNSLPILYYSENSVPSLHFHCMIHNNVRGQPPILA